MTGCTWQQGGYIHPVGPDGHDKFSLVLNRNGTVMLLAYRCYTSTEASNYLGRSGNVLQLGFPLPCPPGTGSTGTGTEGLKAVGKRSRRYMTHERTDEKKR